MKIWMWGKRDIVRFEHFRYYFRSRLFLESYEASGEGFNDYDCHQSARNTLSRISFIFDFKCAELQIMYSRVKFWNGSKVALKYFESNFLDKISVINEMSSTINIQIIFHASFLLGRHTIPSKPNCVHFLDFQLPVCQHLLPKQFWIIYYLHCFHY